MECVSPKGQAAAHDEWLYVPTEFEALYMTCLVENISRKNNLQLLSDSSAAWTGSTFFKYDGEIEDYPTDEQTQQLATLVIRDFIPQNIIDIRPQDLLKFREKYRDEGKDLVRLFVMQLWSFQSVKMKPFIMIDWKI